ncbi:hypothetical protein HMPREF1556_00485 [Porphyromonas sp. oral taxon 278 str. W7784]|nr:hypothetical protein HMPREF1556_00485 [Porphyromonas sp. oral taxon 278 str. W7784]
MGENTPSGGALRRGQKGPYGRSSKKPTVGRLTIYRGSQRRPTVGFFRPLPEPA